MDVQDPQYKTADGSALRIWRDTAQNKFLSEKFGRAIFDEVVYAEIISPGSRDSTPTFELVRKFAPEMARAEPKYGPKYAELKSFVKDFEENETSSASMSGTPLTQWPEMTRTMAASLKAQSIFTVDALAALPDTKLIAVGPDGRTWREKAKAYIENAKDGAYATALAAELERERADKADLQAQVKALADQVAALQAAATGQTPAPPASVEPQPPPATAAAQTAVKAGKGGTPPDII